MVIPSFNLLSIFKSSNNKFVEQWNDKLPSKDRIFYLGILTTSFWTSTKVIQRFLGTIGIHGGRSNNLMLVSGLVSAASCIMLSLAVSDSIASYSSTSRLKGRKARVHLIQNTLIGLTAFVLLERKLFRTMLPSSVITNGVFSPLLFHGSHSIHTLDPVATASQRLKIQGYGKRFGCHHCGARQIFSGANFIADHMPPTKVVNELNKGFWRRIFGLKLSQRLYAQCQRCYSLQGAAVRANNHVLSYHNNLRLTHLAPAIGVVLLESNQHVKKFYASLANDLYRNDKDIDRIAKAISKLKESFR